MVQFRVLHTLTIRGRGRFVIGDLLEGTLRAGMRLRAADAPAEEPLVVEAVEIVDALPRPTTYLAVRLALVPPADDGYDRLSSGTLLIDADAQE